MISYTALTLFAVLTQAVVGSPIESRAIEKRATNTLIRSGRNGQCLSLGVGAIQNGARLTTTNCKDATRWDISPGSGSVLISGSPYALDAGVPQGNNNPAKIWQSYPGSPQQTWYLTADNRIAVAGGNQCLDQGDNGPQTYQCTTGNTNQVWLVDDLVLPPASSASTSASASTVSSAAASPSTTSSLSDKSGVQLNFPAKNLCAVAYGKIENGTPVTLESCYPSVYNQRFNILANGLIQYHDSNFCLDAGSNPSNGVALKLWTCYPGLAQQTFAYPTNSPSSRGLYRTANNQCLDVDSGNNSKLQTWTCSSGDPQQYFRY